MSISYKCNVINIEHMKDVSGNNGDNRYHIDGYIHLIKKEDNHLRSYLSRNYTLYININ